MSKATRISEVKKGSLCDSWGIKAGDYLVSINDVIIEDIFDYYYQIDNLYITAIFRTEDGQEKAFATEKDPDEDLGLTFDNGLLDDYRSCSNGCVFCFIDQMPPGMRETLYFKDDDTRLSFLQGNYATLTNMKEKDLQRIIDYKLSPINVSVHATNPELRCKLLRNRFAGKLMEQLNMLRAADIEMNSQIVLCKGLNDGEELDRTIGDLLDLYPQMQSLSVVPVGLTKFREGLTELETFEKEEALSVIKQVEGWQQVAMERHGVHFVQASDEWYLTAGLPFPEEERYDGYIQLENGVGMMRLLHEEFMYALEEEGRHFFARGKVTVATGVLAAPMIKELADAFMAKYPRVKIEVVTIINHFFGEKITVSGLITGHDLVEQLKGRDLGNRVLIPCNMMRSGEEVFLDDMTRAQAEQTLQVPLNVVESDGISLLKAFLGKQR